MDANELIRAAAACQRCGEEHTYRVKHGRATWAAEDGHTYQPVLGAGTVATLRALATGVYRSPWVPA